MAIVLKLVRGSATVDLNDGDDGFQLGGRGWVPVVATPVYMGSPPPVTETLQVRLRQTSHNNISTYMQSLHDMQVWAEQYVKDPTEDEPVWFGAMYLLNIEMATTSPPFGLSLFVMKGVAPRDTTMGDIYLGALPFLTCDAVAIILMLIFPNIVLWLPGLMKQFA